VLARAAVGGYPAPSVCGAIGLLVTFPSSVRSLAASPPLLGLQDLAYASARCQLIAH
jgi:hypothetical protein